MTNAIATVGDVRATSLRVRIPAWGCWWADVALDGEHAMKGRVTIEAADLTLQGAIVSGGVRNGRAFYRIAGGAARWGKTIPAKSYATDAGVKISTVVTDAATDAGEEVDAASLPTTSVGPEFARAKGMAARVLELVAPSGWYVGEDGVTRIGRRPRRDYAGKATRVTTEPDRGTIELAAESLADLVPGVVVDGLEAIDVEHEINAKSGVRTTIWGNVGDAGDADRSRSIAALRRIFEQFDPNRKYRSTWEYRVVSLAGKRLNLQPSRASSGMPILLRVPVRAGVPGVDIVVKPGALVLVQFIDESPARPFVAHFEAPDGAGWKPLSMSFDAETIVQIGKGVRPFICAGDLAGGLFPVAPTQIKAVGG